MGSNIQIHIQLRLDIPLIDYIRLKVAQNINFDQNNMSQARLANQLPVHSVYFSKCNLGIKIELGCEVNMPTLN